MLIRVNLKAAIVKKKRKKKTRIKMLIRVTLKAAIVKVAIVNQMEKKSYPSSAMKSNMFSTRI